MKKSLTTTQPRIRKSLTGPRMRLGSADHTEVSSAGSELQVIKAPETDVDSMDSAIFAMKRNQKKINVTTTGKIRIVSQIDGDREYLCCKYDDKQKTLCAGFSEGHIKGYDIISGEEQFTLSDRETEIDVAPVTSIKFRPVASHHPLSNSITATYANGCVKCWNLPGKQCIFTIREKRQTFGIAYHPIQPKFITFGDNLKLYMYDEETKTLERSFSKSENTNKHDGPMSRVFAICFNPRSYYEFLSGGWDDVIHYWDIRQPAAVRHISGMHICGEGIDINAKGTEILIAAWQKENPLQLFDYSTGKLITVLEADVYNSKLYCARFVSTNFAVSGGIDPNLFRVIDLQTFVTIASASNLPGGVYGFDLGPMQRTVKRDKVQVPSRTADVTTLPRIAFVSGKKLYQVEFPP